jgi:hypothetical protein
MNMKINPPKPEILPGDPYKNDIFGNRKEFGDSITSIIKNIEESMVLCIDAQWGDGKTTFAEMWMQDLTDKKYKYIHFNAFEHDYTEDPFISFSAEILSLLKNEYKELKMPTGNFKKKVVKVGKMVLPTLSKIALKLISFGIIEPQLVDSVKGVFKDTSSDVTGFISKTIEEQLGSYNEDKKTITEFGNELKKIGSVLKEKIGFPLLIIVDELDRCRPDFALKLIERIKHLFSVDNVSFVLLTNLEQLENHVKCVYGQGIDAYTYLQKFFTVCISIPEKEMRVDHFDYSNFTKGLFEFYKIDSAQTGSRFIEVFNAYFYFYSLSLRQIESCFKIIVLLVALDKYKNIRDKNFVYMIISFLLVLYMYYPEVFNNILFEENSGKKIMKETNYHEVDKSTGWISLNPEWFLECILYYSMTADEFALLDIEDKNRMLERITLHRSFGVKREKLLSLLCQHISCVVYSG